MRAERAQQLSRFFFVLALVLVLLALVWALRTPPAPSADRYDYVGRAFQATQGDGLRPLVSYPLRMVFPGANDWPPENLTRPPLWPALLVPGVRFGMDARTGVWFAAGFTLLLLWGMRWIGDRSFGGAAGAVAGLAIASSFSTWTVLLGGGPEPALALITLILWTWIPRGGGIAAHLACGSLYGLLPLLHPTGWVFALAAFLARSDRYQRSQLIWVAVGAILVALPWHLQLWLATGNPMGALQSYAELARNLDDPGGLGPYRGLQPFPTVEVLTERGADVLRLTLHRLKMQFLHLDTWLAWPLIALALYGALHELRLATRDALLGIAIFVTLAPWSAEFRTLFPILPVACLWVGVGFSHLVDRVRPPIAVGLGILAALGPWLLPLGISTAPPRHAPGWSQAQLSPPAALVNRLRETGNASAPIFTDSAVLAWRARRGAVLLPDTPATLKTLTREGPLTSTTILALGLGRESSWCPGEEWSTFLASCKLLYQHPEGAVLLEIPPDPPPPIPVEAAVETETETDEDESGLTHPTLPLVDRGHLLAPNFIPDDLVELPLPPANRQGLRVRAEAAEALLSLIDAAREEGVELRVVSAFRSYQRQEELFASAEARHGEGQSWVAPPGASEHQLGTTVDFADSALLHVVEPSFSNTIEGRWLANNALRHGFRMSYPPGSFEQTGYQPEAWHFRYIGTLEEEETETEDAP